METEHAKSGGRRRSSCHATMRPTSSRKNPARPPPLGFSRGMKGQFEDILLRVGRHFNFLCLPSARRDHLGGTSKNVPSPPTTTMPSKSSKLPTLDPPASCPRPRPCRPPPAPLEPPASSTAASGAQVAPPALVTSSASSPPREEKIAVKEVDDCSNIGLFFFSFVSRR